ncbi:tyrosine-type recombinase/integrase [Chloroflexota bacterium]
MKTSVLELQNLIDGFKLSCQTEGKSPKTTEWYISFLLRFLRFLKENNYPAGIANINRNHIRAFILYLQQDARVPHTGKHLSSSTIQGYVRTLRVFFSWAAREEYIESNPMTNVPVPRGSSKIINTFSNEQVARLFDLCARSNGQGQRNLSIILLLLDSGIRVSELANIGLDDVNLAEGHIKIKIAKGSKERIVPIGSLVQKALWKYINCCRQTPMTGKVTGLFLVDSGIPLAKNGIQQMIRRLAQKAGMQDVRCNPHIFRHTFATMFSIKGGSPEILQLIMGHESFQTTQEYLHPQPQDLRKQHLRYSPVTDLFGDKY